MSGFETKNAWNLLINIYSYNPILRNLFIFYIFYLLLKK